MNKIDYGYIIYNNRSMDGVVKNFLPNLDIELLLDVESKLKWLQSLHNSDRFVEINPNELDLKADDVYYGLEDVKIITNIVLEAHNNMSSEERNWLYNRGINDQMIKKYKLGGLSFIDNYETLKVLGVTIHPMLKPLMKEGLGSGILFPLFDNTYPLPGKLINCAVRRINDEGKLKYTHACPDVDIWGFEKVFENDSVWLCEGVFDMIAINSIGLKSIAACSGMWSSIQLTKLIIKKPKLVTIWVDNDEVGIRNAYITKKLLNMFSIPVKQVISDCKDAAEHILEKKRNIDTIKEINITKDMIRNSKDESFNFLKYLKNRSF